MNSERNIIVHVHIFKNAGSSFDDALKRNFAKDFVDHREDHLIHKNKDFLNAYMSENQHVRAFSSHSVYDKPIDFNNVTYHTAYFVRHPIDRIKSVYSFEYKQPAEDSLGARMAKEFDLKGYVEWRMSPEAPPTIRNMQTIFIAGMGKGNGRMEARYEAALKTLEQNSLVALVDRYDESMVVFEEYLKEVYPNIDLSYIRRNVTDNAHHLSAEEKAQKLLSELGAELAQTVLKNNQYDIQLYNKANELLDEKISNIENFEEKLENFKQRCIQIKENPESIVEASLSGKAEEKEIIKKKNIILHIGRHKSGTSSLQKFLCDNESFLDKKGFYYPKNLRRKIAHHPLANYYHDKFYSNLTQEDHKEIEAFWKEIEEHDNIIISSEAFQNINPVNLIQDFKNFNVTVVIYLRDQVSYLLSAYAQAVKARKITQTLEEYESTVFKDMNYLRFIQKWEKALPNAKIVVQLFDKNSLIGADIRKDFLVHCDICSADELDLLDYSFKDQNPSIGGALLEFKRLLNFTDFDTKIDVKKLYIILQTLATVNSTYKLQKVISKELYELLVNKYQESNAMVSKLYFKDSLLEMEQPESFSNQFTIDEQTMQEIIENISDNNNIVSKELRENYIFSILNLLSKSKNKTPSLDNYFLLKKDELSNNIVYKIMSMKESKQDVAEMSNLVDEFIESHKTIDDTVAISTIVKKYFRNHKDFDNMLSKITLLQENFKIKDIKKAISSKKVSHVTIITSSIRLDSEHLKLIFIYVISLLTQSCINKISIIFTSEMEWFTWRLDNRKIAKEKYLKKFKELLNTDTSKNFLDNEKINNIEKYVDIVSSPRDNEFEAYLGDVVIRFEGQAIFRTTHIFGKDILENRPVVTSIYNTTVTKGKNSDMTILCHRDLSDGQVYFLSSAGLSKEKFYELSNDIKIKNTSIKKMVTIFSNRRIEMGLKGLKLTDWESLSKLFLINLNLQWHLIGSSNPEAARQYIPSEIEEKYGDRINIYEIIPADSLKEFLNPSSIFLALPGISGGGGISRTAVSSGMLVLGHNSLTSDISHFLPSEFKFEDISDAFKLIERYVKDIKSLNKARHNLLEHFLYESDLNKKGKELVKILNKVKYLKSPEFNQ